MSEDLPVEESKSDSHPLEIDENSYSSLIESVSGLAEALDSLNQQAVQAYAPVVNDILRSRSRDIRHIEHTLDRLLSFCGYQPALQLYRKLCRYYFDIDPAATVAHIDAYREYYDSEPPANLLSIEEIEGESGDLRIDGEE